jgi:hypothetical protein
VAAAARVSMRIRYLAYGACMVLGLAAAALLLLLLSAGRAEAQELRVTEAVGEVLAPTTPPAEAAAPVVDSVVKPVVDPVVDPIVKPVVDPVVSPVVGPVVKPVVDPVVDPVVKPVVDPVVKPVVDPVVKPVTSPTDAPTKPTPAAVATPAPGSTTVAISAAPSGSDATPRASGAPRSVPTSKTVVFDIAPASDAAETVPSVAAAPPPPHDTLPVSPTEPIPAPRDALRLYSGSSSRPLDTSRALELLLYAITATIVALQLPRGRRVINFGAVMPRTVCVSPIERPG